MKILVKKVYPGTTYEEKIYDYSILAGTETGLEIVLFDRERFDLRQYEGKIVNCLINAFYPKIVSGNELNRKYKPEHPIIRGIFIGDYNIPDFWLEYEDSLILEGWYAVKNADGVFIIDPNDFQYPSINVDDEIIFTVGRLDLLAWHPLDD